MKTRIMRLISLMLSALILLSFVSCTKNEIRDVPQEENRRSRRSSGLSGELTEFHYEFGSYNGGYWNYHIFKKDGKVYLESEGFNGVDLNANGEVPEGTLADINDIIQNHDIRRWNGFHKSDRNVLDGYSFSISGQYEHGELRAYGYMKYPKNYEAGHDALAKYLESLADSIYD